MKQLSKCPKCAASHWIELYRNSTLVYTFNEHAKGKVIIKNPNAVLIHVRCLECSQEFNVLKEGGEYI